MNDLISKEEVMNIIQEELSLRCGHEADIALFSVKKKVSELPTAFDTEKVVEQLEKLKQHNKKLSEGAYLEDDKSFYFCAYTNFAKAIDIVKKGGVE